jgi:hypothetical protein
MYRQKAMITKSSQTAVGPSSQTDQRPLFPGGYSKSRQSPSGAKWTLAMDRSLPEADRADFALPFKISGSMPGR